MTNPTNEELRQILISKDWINDSKVERLLGIPDKTISKFKNATYTTKDGTIKRNGLKEKYREPLIIWLSENVKF